MYVRDLVGHSASRSSFFGYPTLATTAMKFPPESIMMSHQNVAAHKKARCEMNTGGWGPDHAWRKLARIVIVCSYVAMIYEVQGEGGVSFADTGAWISFSPSNSRLSKRRPLYYPILRFGLKV